MPTLADTVGPSSIPCRVEMSAGSHAITKIAIITNNYNCKTKTTILTKKTKNRKVEGLAACECLKKRTDTTKTTIFTKLTRKRDQWKNMQHARG